MKKCGLFALAGMMVAMLAITAVSPAAGQIGSGSGRAPGMAARHLMMNGFVRGLNLTADQKTQIKTILQSNKPQILQARRDLVKARLDIIQGSDGAAGELANARSEAANLRKLIFQKIKPILTQDQIAKVQERRQFRQQRLQKQLDRLNAKISG